MHVSPFPYRIQIGFQISYSIRELPQPTLFFMLLIFSNEFPGTGMEVIVYDVTLLDVICDVIFQTERHFRGLRITYSGPISISVNICIYKCCKYRQDVILTDGNIVAACLVGFLTC